MKNLNSLVKYTALLIISIFVFACGGTKELPSPSDKKAEAYFRDNTIANNHTKKLTSSGGTQWIHIEYIGAWSILTEYPEGGAAWCSIASESGTNDAKIWVNITENKEPTARKVIFRVKMGDKIVPLTINQLGRDGTSAGLYSKMVEVPAFTENDTLKFISHSMVVDGKSVRNYTILYDIKNLYPVWVAYPNNTYTYGSVGRTNAWEYDPNLSRNIQPDLYRGIGGGYDRGHMLPSFARTATEAMNEQTFYFTNMSAQLAGFNQNKWLRTEELIKNKRGSGSDTLFVVTGCVLQTVGGNEPITKHRNKNDGKMMAVPNYYYKVVLKIFGDGRKQAIAFWLEHKAASGHPTKEDTRTIRWVEEQTGINFFANLPQDVQDDIETQHNPSAWGVKD